MANDNKTMCMELTVVTLGDYRAAYVVYVGSTIGKWEPDHSRIENEGREKYFGPKWLGQFTYV